MSPLSERFLADLAAAAVAEGLADAVFCRLSTPIGKLLVVQGPLGVCRVGFAEDPEDALLADVASLLGPRILAADRELATTRDALQAYFEAGEDPGVPVDLRLVRSPFRRQVLETLHAEVHAGQVVTYAGLAARAGYPRAARATGTACATNPVPVIVPCHRVLPGGGGVGSYGGGPARKRALLELEGALPRPLGV
jgi:methylated-DNA-[protein]-cysteine S-methyltransferase